VVGTESAIVNAVAMEQPLKIVLLSHSGEQQLTRRWINTVPVAPTAVSCYPCHRIHRSMEHCNADPVTGAAACQAAVSADAVAQTIRLYLQEMVVEEAA
jgi:hypothetical protein